MLVTETGLIGPHAQNINDEIWLWWIVNELCLFLLNVLSLLSSLDQRWLSSSHWPVFSLPVSNISHVLVSDQLTQDVTRVFNAGCSASCQYLNQINMFNCESASSEVSSAVRYSVRGSDVSADLCCSVHTPNWRLHCWDLPLWTSAVSTQRCFSQFVSFESDCSVQESPAAPQDSICHLLITVFGGSS